MATDVTAEQRGHTSLDRLQHMPALKEAGLWPAEITAIHNLEQLLKENRPDLVDVLEESDRRFESSAARAVGMTA